MNKIKLIAFLLIVLVVFSGCSSKEKTNSKPKESVVLSGFIVPEFDDIKESSSRNFYISKSNLDKADFIAENGVVNYLLHFSTEVEVNKELKFIIPEITCFDENSKQYSSTVSFIGKNITDYSIYSQLPLNKIAGLDFEIVLNQNIPNKLTCKYNLLYGDPRQVKGSSFTLEFEK